jgi:hypothetical protein
MLCTSGNRRLEASGLPGGILVGRSRGCALRYPLRPPVDLRKQDRLSGGTHPKGARQATVWFFFERHPKNPRTTRMSFRGS